MYADDTTLIYTQQNIVDLESNIIDELEKISLWFKSNRLLINLSKTNCVTFHNKTCKIANTLSGLTLKMIIFLYLRLILLISLVYL